MATSSHFSSHNFTVKSTMFLFLLISLVTSAKSVNILQRERRGSVTVGELPQIKPPVQLKKGEPKYSNPGWTHCIKYLQADVRWRSIRSVNIKKLQATQFQCSWFIASDVPGSQVRISFEKLDFGGVPNSCTQQFLEIIDIKLGKSQGRICGDKSKRQGDYVSAGQRVRIDIQGEEPLVAKIRAGEEPFIISYKIVKEPPGFRVGQTKNIELKNKVKTSLGHVIENSKTIYGTRNQPGANDPPDDPESDGRSSLTIWQVVIIIVISLAVLSCIIGVVIKRLIFDKKKKEEYLKLEEGNLGSESKEEKLQPLPGVSIKPFLTSEKKSYLEDEKTKRSRKLSDNAWSEKEKEIPRSSSKPEETVKKSQKIKRHNSHGDATAKPKVTKNRKRSTEDEKPKPVYENTKQKKQTQSNGVTNTTNGSTKSNLESEITPSNRPPRRSTSRTGVKDIKTSAKVASHPGSNGIKKTKKIDENKNTITNNGSRKKVTSDPTRRHHKKRNSESAHKKVKSDKTKKREPVEPDETKKREPVKPDKTKKREPVKPDKTEKRDPVKTPKEGEDDTPSSRAQKRPRSKKRPAKQSVKSETEKGTNDVKRTEEKKQENKNGHSHKKREHTKPEGKSGNTKRKKTVSSAHKKVTTATGKISTSTKRTGAHKTKRPRTETKKDHDPQENVSTAMKT